MKKKRKSTKRSTDSYADSSNFSIAFDKLIVAGTLMNSLYHNHATCRNFRALQIQYNFGSYTPRVVKQVMDDISKILFYLAVVNTNKLDYHLPYSVKVGKLIAKNRWTKGTYVAINHPDSTLELNLNVPNVKKLIKQNGYKRVVGALTWVIAHELRHKIQQTSPEIRSVIKYPNWENFNRWMQKQTGKDEDFINHIFHELNPAEVDANIFASELTGITFKGNAFDINDESLALLKSSPSLIPKD